MPFERVEPLGADPRLTGLRIQPVGFGEQVVDALPEFHQVLDRLAAGAGEDPLGGLRPPCFGILGFAKERPPAAANVDAADVGDGEA